MWFEAILELKVNLGKSELILIGRVDNMEELTLEIGCKVVEEWFYKKTGDVEKIIYLRRRRGSL